MMSQDRMPIDAGEIIDVAWLRPAEMFAELPWCAIGPDDLSLAKYAGDDHWYAVALAGPFRGVAYAIPHPLSSCIDRVRELGRSEGLRAIGHAIGSAQRAMTQIADDVAATEASVAEEASVAGLSDGQEDAVVAGKLSAALTSVHDAQAAVPPDFRLIGDRLKFARSLARDYIGGAATDEEKARRRGVMQSVVLDHFDRAPGPMELPEAERAALRAAVAKSFEESPEGPAVDLSTPDAVRESIGQVAAELGRGMESPRPARYDPSVRPRMPSASQLAMLQHVQREREGRSGFPGVRHGEDDGK